MPKMNTLFLGKREKIVPPNGDKKVLLHSCCAPCSGEIIEAMIASNIDITIYFYNPNIHPQKEYLIRKNENIKFAKKHNIPFVDADYDVENWFEKAKGMEWEPERGKRCTMCFDMRFEKTAEYASENDFKVITSSLGLSRWKNMEQINQSGLDAASKFPEITYWTLNWRKKGGSDRMYQIAKAENMYKQEYCGCAYSLRETNNWRKNTGREVIHLGETFYT